MGIAEPASRPSKTLPIVLIIIIVVLAGAFGFLFVQSSGTISALNKSITTQSSQLAANAAEIAADNAMITQDKATVANLTSSVTLLRAQVSALASGYAKANQTIFTISMDITTDLARITSLNSQITTLEAQVTSLQTITNLTASTVEVNSQQFSTGTTGTVQVASFTVTYAGYVLVRASAASDFANEGAATHNTFASSVSSNGGGVYIPNQGYFFIFGSASNSAIFPVVPGTVTVYLVTSDLTSQTATLTVTFIY